MTGNWQTVLALSGVVMAGINAGAFFAFSSFVMRGLGELPDNQGAAAMQQINRFAPNPAFGLTLFGVIVVGLVLVVSTVGDIDQPHARWLLAAFVLSVATMAITGAFHIPRNNMLDGLDADAPSTAAVWRNYLTVWTRGNHVRLLTAAASSASFAMALRA